MFDSLSTKLSHVFNKLVRRGQLTELDVSEALGEVRVALLDADVALPVVNAFIDKIKPLATGQDVLRDVKPGHMVVKIVHDELTHLLGDVSQGLNLAAVPPAVILMAGLQGSGKTTTTAKLALYLKEKLKKKVLMASLDVYRPAAQEQLKVLGEEIHVTTLPIIVDEKPLTITERALKTGRLEGYDVVLLDTAGRLHIDEPLMDELVSVQKLAKPVETLLVADAMTGQDAVTMAEAFHQKVKLTGIILTRMDGDARGGAALSMRHVTGSPIKFFGTGEKLTQLELFHPDRLADRILGMGDIVSLVEKAAESIAEEDMERLRRKFQKGQFDLADFAFQMRTMQKMGGTKAMAKMFPGMAAAAEQLEGQEEEDDRIKYKIAIIQSMTPKERRYPALLTPSRRRRIAKGAGLGLKDIAELLKEHEKMLKMMKKMGGIEKKIEKMGGMEVMMAKMSELKGHQR